MRTMLHRIFLLCALLAVFSPLAVAGTLPDAPFIGQNDGKGKTKDPPRPKPTPGPREGGEDD